MSPLLEQAITLEGKRASKNTRLTIDQSRLLSQRNECMRYHHRRSITCARCDFSKQRRSEGNGGRDKKKLLFNTVINNMGMAHDGIIHKKPNQIIEFDKIYWLFHLITAMYHQQLKTKQLGRNKIFISFQQFLLANTALEVKKAMRKKGQYEYTSTNCLLIYSSITGTSRDDCK